ncbi:MAG: hypothetical protein IJT36_10005 [Alphaproteobacteria bacterium]|nr:hypothetical protein [Alphaproteobacteria bacterium]
MENIKSNKLFCCAVAVLIGVCSNLYGSDHAPDPFALGAPAHRLAPGHTMTDKEIIDFATARIAEIEAQIPLWQQMLDEEKYDELRNEVYEMYTYISNFDKIPNVNQFVNTQAEGIQECNCIVECFGRNEQIFSRYKFFAA